MLRLNVRFRCLILEIFLKIKGVFTADVNPTDPIKGVYAPGPEPSSDAAFKPSDPNKVPSKDSHGMMRPGTGSPPIPGTLKAPDYSSFSPGSGGTPSLVFVPGKKRPTCRL
jgi:hypothetical protein